MFDHLFVTRDGQRTPASVAPDPFVVLPAIGAMSSSLRLGAIVANCGLVHPAYVLLHLAQLASLFGGDRVVAGLGAGWNAEEFDALGALMPPHAERTRRLEETLQIARQLVDNGTATLDGASVTVRSFPTRFEGGAPFRILVGSGSDRLLELAARYADYLDLNGSSRRKKLGRVDAALKMGFGD